VLEKLELAHVGGYGVGHGHGCKGNRIEQCHIHDLGAGGVLIGEMDLPAQEQGCAERNTVFNCYIHDGGRVYATAVGVWVGKSSHNTILHNEISDFFYTGISVGWSWGYQPSSANHNIIESNHVHHLGFGVLSDMGGIYTLGVSPGTRICNNLFHHVESYSYGGWGIYTDEGSTDIVIENNVVYRTKDGSFHQHYGKDNIVRNNIFAYSRLRQIVRTRDETHRSFVFEHNIVYYTTGTLLGSNWAGDRTRYELDYNDYWDTSGRPVTFAKATFAQWQAKGQDTHSIIADPQFVDAANYDFRLKPDCAALKMGFKAIDVSKVGLVGPREWVELPKSVKRRWVEIH
jgi:parallel beta-helix repeat protein